MNLVPGNRSPGKQRRHPNDFDFVQIISKWPLEKFKNDELPYPEVQVAELRYSDTSSYYNRSTELVVNDACASISTGLKELHKPKFNLSLTANVSKPGKHGNPYIFNFRGIIKTSKATDSGYTMNVLLLESGDMRFIAIASVNDEVYLKAKANLICSSLFDDPKNKHQFKAGHIWSATYLCCLVTHERMFNACTSGITPTCLSSIVSGKKSQLHTTTISTSTSTSTNRHMATRSTGLSLSGLNSGQYSALCNFDMLPTGSVDLIQGPPGTGKTTMLINFIHQLYIRNKNVLVCAPSNKAVQVLAKRFQLLHPGSFAIIMGVESKLDAELLPMHYSRDYFTNLHSAFVDIHEISGALLEKKFVYLKLLQCETKRMMTKLSDYKQISMIFKIYYTREYNRVSVMCDKVEQLLKTSEALVTNAAVKRSGLQLIRQLYSYCSQIIAAIPQPGAAMDRQVVTRSKVIFTTLSYSGGKLATYMDKCDVLIVDEAGQSVETEVLIALERNPDKVLLVGDRKQLRATVTNQISIDKKYDVSMMDRISHCWNHECHMLTEQYRMHTEQCQYVSSYSYGGKLVTAESIVTDRINWGGSTPRPRPAGELCAPYAFYNIASSSEVNKHPSYSNEVEAGYVCAIIKQIRLDAHKKHCTIGVITFYNGQKELITSKLKTNKTSLNGIEVSSVDGFQGSECDIIIISL